MIKKKRKLTLGLIDERLQQLPLLPAVVCELMSLNEDSPEFYDIVTTLSKNDPALATRVLQIVNSAASAPAQTIMDLNQALIRVGINKILALISLLSVTKVFTPTTEQQKSLWQHSIETAHFAEFIALHTTDFNVDKSLAYTCGLLHDIGRFVMFEVSSRSIDVIDSKGWETPIELPDVENKLLGFTHADAGYLAAKKWGLPKAILNVVRHHHYYDIWSKSRAPIEFKQLVTTIQFADFLSVLIERNPGWLEWDEALLYQEIEKYCIHNSWPYINFPIDELIKGLPAMTMECNQAMERLRLD